MNQNKLLILMIILVFIAVTLGITCVMLDKFPPVDWADLFAGGPGEGSSDPVSGGPSGDTAPMETTNAPTTNKPTTSAPTTEAPSTSAPTDEPKRGGCGASIGGGLAIVMMLGAAVAVTKKRK